MLFSSPIFRPLGGGCTPLYKGRVGVLGFGVESGMVFEGTTGAYMNGRIYRFSSR